MPRIGRKQASVTYADYSLPSYASLAIKYWCAHITTLQSRNSRL